MFDELCILPGGRGIPRLAFGTWQIPDDVAARAVEDALSVGYRHIDTAWSYHNERGVGEGIRKSGFPRDRIFLTTKAPSNDMDHDLAAHHIDESIDALGVDYVDLLLIHGPRPWPHTPECLAANYDRENLEEWRAVCEAKAEGKARTIGVSNFDIHDLENLFDHSDVRPAVNQIAFHIGWDQGELLDFCHEVGILVEAYSPIATGRLLQNGVVEAMARSYRVTVPQLCIRYDLQRVDVVLAKSTHREYMATNAELDFSISEDDMRRLREGVETIPHD